MVFTQTRIFLFVATAWIVQGQPSIRGGDISSTVSTTERILSICNNNAPYTDVDDGCSAGFPMCMQANGWLPPANVGGDMCAKCINIYDSDVDADMGCTNDLPNCNAQLGQAGLECLPPKTSICQNTAIDATADRGCTANAPVCYNVLTGMDIAYGASGTKCGRCFNTLPQGYHDVGVADYGCPAANPRCAALDGTDAPLSLIGTRCCPATGCVITSSCPCNLPNTFHAYIVKNGVNLVNLRSCNVGPNTLHSYFTWHRGGSFLGAGEETPGSGFLTCFSISSNEYVSVHYKGITQAEADICFAELKQAFDKSGASCVPF